MVKLTAVSILKWNGDKEAFLLGIAADVSSFGYFQRSTVKEMLTFLSRTVAQRTQPGQRQSVQQEEYYAHIFNRDGLVGVAIVDKDYPARAAFGVVNKILDDFSELSQQRWRSLQADSPDAQPVVDAAITKFQVCHVQVHSVSHRGADGLQGLQVCTALTLHLKAFVYGRILLKQTSLARFRRTWTKQK